MKHARLGKGLIGLCAWALAGVATLASGEDEWLYYSNVRDVRDIAHDGDSLLWVATGGGVLRFDKRTAQRTDDFSQFSTFDGMAANPTIAVAVDGTGMKWFAHDQIDAGLSVLDQDGRWTVIPPRDGLLLASGAKSNTLFASGDSVWVGTESGLTLFRGLGDPEIRLDLDDGLPASNVQAITRQGGFIWVGTDQGLARLEGGFITTYTEADGLIDNNVLSLAASQPDERELWVGTENGISVLTAGGDSIRAMTTSGLGSRIILAIDFEDSLPWVGTAASGLAGGDGGPARLEGGIWRRFIGTTLESGEGRLYSVDTRALGVFADEVWVGTRDPLNSSFGVLSALQDKWFDFLRTPRNRPRVPLTNFFGALDLDASGDIWTTSSVRRDGEVPGEYSQALKFDGDDRFLDFQVASFPAFGSNKHDAVRVDPLDQKWFGFWDNQGGLAVVSPDETSVSLINIDTICEVDAQTRQACTQIRFDSDGRLWGTFDFTGLVCIDLTTEECVAWTTADGLSNQPDGATANAVALDPQGRAWVGLFEASLVMVDPRGTVFDKSDDLVVRYSAATTPLPSSTIHTVEVDASGRVWVGTEAGLAILDPGDDSWVVHRIGGQILDASIRSIAFLPDGGALFGDNAGNVYTLLSDLNTFGPTYNALTIGFPRSRVSQIRFDEGRSTAFMNVVWLATYGGGLIRANFDLTEQEEVDTGLPLVNVYPNPFFGSDDAQVVTFEGLQPGSTVWLYTVLGERVADLATAAGDSLVTWDTRNREGRKVASGVYFFTVRREGAAHESGKVAIVR